MFTGPFSNLDQCQNAVRPSCVPSQRSHTKSSIPYYLVRYYKHYGENCRVLASLLTAKKITCTIISELAANNGLLSSYDDFFSGSNYLKNVKTGDIGGNDIVIMLSIDGAQLYAHKSSDCWIYIWVIMGPVPQMSGTRSDMFSPWWVHPWAEQTKKCRFISISRPTPSLCNTTGRPSYLGRIQR